MPITLSDEIRALLDAPNFAHLATLMPDGSPQSVPIWVGREGDRILICTGEGSLKAKNTRRDPRVSLSIVDFYDPYKEAQLRGRVVERRPDDDCKYIDAISHKYTGKPFPFRSPEGRVALVIEVEKARYTKLHSSTLRPSRAFSGESLVEKFRDDLKCDVAVVIERVQPAFLLQLNRTTHQTAYAVQVS